MGIDFKYEKRQQFRVKYVEELPGFTRDGYEFLGWSTDKDAEQPEYGGIYKPMNVSFTENTTLYAIWVKKRCTITFNAGGGEFNVGYRTVDGKKVGTAPFLPELGYEVTVKDDKVVEVKKTIIKGHELGEIPYVLKTETVNDLEQPFMLIGWFDSTIGGNIVSRFSRLNQDMTVYAQWYPDTSANEWKPMERDSTSGE